MRRSTRLLSKEKSSSRITSNQLTNASTSRKKSKDILVEFDNYIFSVSFLYVGLFVCIIMPGITFLCLKQSVKLVNLLPSCIPGYILENKGCFQFNCKGANIDSSNCKSQWRMSHFSLTLLAYRGRGVYTPQNKCFL